MRGSRNPIAGNASCCACAAKGAKTAPRRYRPDAGKLTVKQVCESFLAHCEERHQRDERMTRKMLTVYKGHIKNHILQRLDTLAVDGSFGRRISRSYSDGGRDGAYGP